MGAAPGAVRLMWPWTVPVCGHLWAEALRCDGLPVSLLAGESPTVTCVIRGSPRAHHM